MKIKKIAFLLASLCFLVGYEDEPFSCFEDICEENACFSYTPAIDDPPIVFLDDFVLTSNNFVSLSFKKQKDADLDCFSHGCQAVIERDNKTDNLYIVDINNFSAKTFSLTFSNSLSNKNDCVGFLYGYTEFGMTCVSPAGESFCEIICLEKAFENGLINSSIFESRYQRLIVTSNKISANNRPLNRQTNNQFVTIEGSFALDIIHGQGTTVLPIQNSVVVLRGKINGDPYVIDSTHTTTDGTFCFMVDPTNYAQFSDFQILLYPITSKSAISHLGASENLQYWASPLYTSLNGIPYIEEEFVVTNSLAFNYFGQLLSISQFMLYGSKYAELLSNEVVSSVNVLYPSSVDGQSYFDSFSNTIGISSGNHLGFDLILHEYGHYVQKRFGFESSTYGSHSFSSNLCATFNDKYKGTRTAWNESWPSLFGDLVGKYFYSSLSSIPQVGDGYFDEPGFLGVNLESNNLKIGEACEQDIICVLFDLFDDFNENESFDKISLGHQGLWNLLSYSGCESFHDFAEIVFGDLSINSGDFGSLLSEYGMAVSTIVSTSSFSLDAPPSFSWNGANFSSPIDWQYGSTKYSFCAYDEDKQLVFQVNNIINAVSDQSLGLRKGLYTLSASQWDQLLSAQGDTFYIRISCYQDYSWTSGPYWSDFWEFEKPERSVSNVWNFGYSARVLEESIRIFPNHVASFSFSTFKSGWYILQTFGSNVSSRIRVFEDNLLISQNQGDGYGYNAFLRVYLDNHEQYELIVDSPSLVGHSEQLHFLIYEDSNIKNSGYATVNSFESIKSFGGNSFSFIGSLTSYRTGSIVFVPASNGYYWTYLSSDCEDTYLYVLDPRLSTQWQYGIEYDDDGWNDSDAGIHRYFEANTPYLILFGLYNPDYEPDSSYVSVNAFKGA